MKALRTLSLFSMLSVFKAPMTIEQSDLYPSQMDLSQPVSQPASNNLSQQQWQRIVLKVGSALIAPHRDGCSSQYLLSIANFIVKCRLANIDVVLVSSGSVAAGAHLFRNIDTSSMTVKKAMAAAGQSEMMATWDRLFDFNTAQVLLTHADLRHRDRYISIRDTLETLLAQGILPVVNENDTVTTDRLKVGDNDNLSAMVATACQADALIICSDIDGLYDKNPKLHPEAQLIADVHQIDEKIYAMAGGATSAVGTGGMKTKIQAAEKAVASGITTYIVNGFSEQSFYRLLEGKNPGTIFHAQAEPMQDRLHWLHHTTRAQGEIIVDNQFEMNPDTDQDLLSPQDLIEVNGDFDAGDVVWICTEDGKKLAKVKTNYGSCLLNFVASQESEQISEQFNEQLTRTDDPILSEQYIAVIDNHK